MKPVVTILATLLFALGVTACDNSNQENAPAPAPDSDAMAKTNTAAGSTASGDSGSATGDESQPSGDSMAGANQAQDKTASQASQASQASEEDTPKAAVAVLNPTEGNKASATIRFTPEDGGLAYTTKAKGLESGKHGYHIHLYGDCSSADGKSAGTHYNLEGSSKNPPKDIKHITGDLGDLKAGEDGSAEDDGMLKNGSLTGPKSIIGRGVIIHMHGNNPSKPPIGAAGAREACGVIGIAEAQ